MKCGALLTSPPQVKRCSYLKGVSFFFSFIQPHVDRDMKLLEKFADSSKKIQMWDLPYLTAVARREYLGASASDLNQFSDIDTILTGVNEITRALFNVSVERATVAHGELWDTDVDKLVRNLKFLMTERNYKLRNDKKHLVRQR